MCDISNDYFGMFSPTPPPTPPMPVPWRLVVNWRLPPRLRRRAVDGFLSEYDSLSDNGVVAGPPAGAAAGFGAGAGAGEDLDDDEDELSPPLVVVGLALGRGDVTIEPSLALTSEPSVLVTGTLPLSFRPAALARRGSTCPALYPTVAFFLGFALGFGIALGFGFGLGLGLGVVVGVSLLLLPESFEGAASHIMYSFIS